MIVSYYTDTMIVSYYNNTMIVSYFIQVVDDKFIKLGTKVTMPYYRR